MKVHKHPHHVTHKKKWGEYLLEFFMLFLAVFLGFVAENMREHQVKHQQAKVFASNLFEELKKDTISINKTIDNIKHDAAKLDSFCLFSTARENSKISNSVLYYFAFYTTYIKFYDRNII